MSTPAREEPEDDDADDPRRRATRPLVDRIGFAFVALSVGTVLVVALLMEGAGGGPDLQLLTPYGAVPGRTMAVRAFLFVPELDAPGGIRAAPTDVSLTLIDEDGEVVARGALHPSPRGAPARGEDRLGVEAPPSLGMEGVIDIPSAARGPHVLRAEAPLDGGGVARCQAPIRVSDSPRVPEPRGRPMHALQQYTLFPVEPTPGEVPPSALDLRVVGGACMPGARCRFTVWVGAPAASVRIEDAPTLRAIAPAEPTPPTEGIVGFEAIVDGPEGELSLVASRNGADVARRRVRLPVLLGGTTLDGGFGLLPFETQPTLVPPSQPVIVDGFRERRWERTGSITPPPHDRGVASLPFGALDPGLWRIQLRTDAYGADSAAVRFVYLRAEGERDAHALRAIRARLEREGANDAFTRAMPLGDVDAELQAAHALSLLEMDVITPPIAMSGRMQRESSLDEDRVRVRWLSVFVIVAVALFAAGYVVRRGLTAAKEARALLKMAGDETAEARKNVISMTLTVVAVAILVTLAFAAVAILILARGA